jgi:adenylate cyclase
MGTRPSRAILQMIILFGRIDLSSTTPQTWDNCVVRLPETLFAKIAAEIGSRGGATHVAAANQIIASWPANAVDADRAKDACLAALALRRMTRMVGIGDAPGDQPQALFAIDCSDRIVGADGAKVEPDQLAADFLIAVERLDLVNEYFGTEIAIGERVRSLADERIYARELDPPSAAGWPSGRIYELLGTADRGAAPSWLSLYETGLSAYRTRDFAGALGFFQMVLALRQWDRPSQAMIGRCRHMLAAAANG